VIYAAHGLFWAAFGVTRLIVGLTGPSAAASAPTARRARRAPLSRGMVLLHVVAFGVMYGGIARAAFAGRVPAGVRGQRFVGALVIVIGGAIVVSALAVFRSWRFQATVDAGHELATAGPFRYVRHPIYLGLDLLALGSAIWVPTPTLWAAFALMVLAGDLRARAEEALLTSAFGTTYEAYRARTWRFIPGVY